MLQAQALAPGTTHQARGWAVSDLRQSAEHKANMARLCDPELHAARHRDRVERMVGLLFADGRPKTAESMRDLIECFLEEHDGDVLLTERGVILCGDEYVLARKTFPARPEATTTKPGGGR